MANGADAEDKFVVLSKIRPGSKRDFEFAYRTQSECGSLSRTRSRKVQSNAGSGHGLQNKKLKTYVSRKKRRDEKSGFDKEMEVMSEEEAKSDVVDVVEAKVMCEDDVEKDPEINGFEKAVVGEKEVLVNVVSGYDQVVEEKREPKNAVVDFEKDKNSEFDKGFMDIGEEGRCEEFGDDKVNELVKLVIEFDKENSDVFDKMLMEIEEDRCTEVHKEAVQKEKFEGSENFLMGLEGVRCEDMFPKEVNEPEKAIGFREENLERKEQNNVCEEDEEKGAKGVVQKSVRRFTRSMLQLKVDSAEKPAVKDSGKDKELSGGGDDDEGATVAAHTTRTKYHLKLKDILEMGILEGMPVMYVRAKGKGPGVKGLQGVVKGLGILCFCDACKGNEVVSPNVFELHAGSSNKRPAEYIYLENEKTLRDVLNVIKDSPLETLEEAVRIVIGSSIKSTFCLYCRGSIMDSGKGEPVLLCNTCMEFKESQVGSIGVTETSEGSPEPKSGQKSSHCSSKSSSSSKFKGKITRKDLRMHKLVFEEGGLVDGTEVAYFVLGQKILVGYKNGCGILCSCCDSEISPSQFEVHAGYASRRKPFQHIYTTNGVSLHELSIILSRQRQISTKENDDLCGFCMDGGNLLCCDTCPRAFHLECVNLKAIPSGAWYCRYCENSFNKDRFVEHNANAVAAGRVEGADPIAQITNRCIRIVKRPDTELGGCVLCRGRDFCKSKFGRRTVMLCDQCEREYHVGCLKDNGMEDLKELPKGKWLCCAECKRINLALQKLIDRGEEKLPDAFLNIVRKKHEEGDSDSVADVDVRWRVLRGKNTDPSDGTRVLLSKAVAIFHDRFDPIIETGTKHDLIPSMAYGRTHNGQDYHGMYCAVLTVNQVVVSAGIFRVFGQEVAELPLVATSLDYQGQGYFQCLFSCIEKLLGFLHVKNLVLPSASEAETIWTNKFGFERMTEEELNKSRNDYPLMIFQGTSMLQKIVPKCRIVGQSAED